MRVVLADLPPEARQAIADEWWYRAWAERESTARYARLVEAMRAVGAPPALVQACATAGEDEARHAVLCADLARAFSGIDRWADTPIDPAPLGPARLGTSERLLYEMVAFGCVAETLNAALLLETCEAATDETVRSTARALLKDEVQHGKLGWGYLSWAASRGPVHTLSAHVGRMIAAAASENLRSEDAFCAGWSAPELGYLPRARRIDIFVRCVREVIAPGLAHLGISPAAVTDWLDGQGWAAAGA